MTECLDCGARFPCGYSTDPHCPECGWDGKEHQPVPPPEHITTDILADLTASLHEREKRR